MKKLLLLLTLLLPILSSAQSTARPQFPGGETELNSFVKANIKLKEDYLTLAKNKYTMMSFKVDTAGKMRNIEMKYTQIMSTAKNDINTELRRVTHLVSDSYKWFPAEVGGKKVEAEQIITFTFNSKGELTTRIGASINGELAEEYKNEEITKEEDIEWIEMEEVEEEVIFERVEEDDEEEEMVLIEEEEEIEMEEMYIISDVIPEPEMKTDNEVFEVYQVSARPEFPGGDEAMEEFIYSNLIMPKAAIQNGVSDRVFIEFIVNKEGKIEDIKISGDGVGFGCNEEAIRVIKLMNKKYTWTPSKARGEVVKTRYRYSIVFDAEKHHKETGRRKDYN